MVQMEQYIMIRVGAGAAVGAAVLGATVNMLHGDMPSDPHEALARIAGSQQWGLLHLGIIVTVLLILTALLGLSQAARGNVARPLALGAAALALPGTAVSLIVTTIDGSATKVMADAWAASESTAAFGDALAVASVQDALFHAEAAFFFGLPILLIGLAAQFPDAGLPRLPGVLALAGGAGALTFGACGLAGLELPGLLFNGFALLITAWALCTGILVWRRTPAPPMDTVARPRRSTPHPPAV